MDTKVTLLVVGIVGFGVLLGGYAVDAYFLPETATQVDESNAADSSAIPLARGTFSGTTGHHVSGTVTLFEDDDGYYLQFENYRQTQGPDVFVYLTPASDPDTRAEIDAGRKLRIAGGTGDGESTKEGTFVQRVPPDIDPTQYGGVAIWCDRFSVPFGHAPLEPVA